MPTPRIDLRSDTVTLPTEAMRKAMADAELGDDGYGEDPTVRRLEERFAELVGKEAALFVPSGVMANQIALRLLTRPGDLVAAGRSQHVVQYELGAAGRNAGVQFAPIDDSAGVLAPDGLRLALAGSAHHLPEIRAIFIESSHMASGGRCWSIAALDGLAALAKGRPIHLDGARLFNAAVASEQSPASLAAQATTVMSCLSKGLCAPVGSLLAASAELIVQARIERKRLGGAMRQAGVLAAAGEVALVEMRERLVDDHRRARLLAEAVADRWPAQADEVLSQPTNLVVFEHEDSESLLAHLSEQGIGAGTIAPGRVRLVCHAGVDDRQVDEVRRSIEAAP